MHHPGEQAFALRLRTNDADADALAGEIEHVLSGERSVFHDGGELIAQLKRLRALWPLSPKVGVD